MEALLDTELIERGSIINNFEARDITIILTIFRKTKKLKNMRIFIPEKVLIYTCVEMPVGFTKVASTTARTSNLYTTRDLRESRMKSFGLKMLHSLNGEKITLTFKSLHYLLITDEIFFLV